MREPLVLLVLAASTGGIGRHVQSLARELHAHGVPVCVAAPAATDALFRFSVAGAHPVPVAPLALRAAVRQADVVHAHGLRAALLAGLAARTVRPRPPLVVTWHNAMLGTGVKRLPLSLLERVVARLGDVTLGASGDLVSRAGRLGARDARLAPVAAPPLPAPRRSRQAVRDELGATDRPLLLAVGRLAPQKGYPVLLDAARGWAARRPAPLVAVAGEGPLRGPLEERIASEGLPVRLLGHRSDVADLLAAADVVVLPSRWEARALVAQEALRAGTPLVATAVGGVPELVGEAAILVPYGDAAALERAVSGLLDSPAAARRLADIGRAQAARWPDEAAAAEQVLAVYREIAALRPSNRER